MVLFNLLQQNITVTLNMIKILKHFSLQLGEAGKKADLLFLILTLIMGSLLWQQLNCECIILG